MYYLWKIYFPVSQIPQVTEEMDAAIKALGNLESLFSDVEISLLALEDTIDARELQEKQVEHHLQMSVYQEKRKANFNDLSNQLQKKYESRKQEVERLKSHANQEKQKHYQEQFERDMSVYRTSGMK